jgi:hypothetical protein
MRITFWDFAGGMPCELDFLLHLFCSFLLLFPMRWMCLPRTGSLASLTQTALLRFSSGMLLSLSFSVNPASFHSSEQPVFFGEGVCTLRIAPDTQKTAVMEGGIGGFSTIFSQCYHPNRDLLWSGGKTAPRQPSISRTLQLTAVAFGRAARAPGHPASCPMLR